MVLAGGADDDAIGVDDGGDDVVGSVEGDDEIGEGPGDALVVDAGGVEGAAVEVGALRAGGGAPVSVLVEVLVVPVAGVSGRTFR
jgi:hypothetical protein